MGASTLQSVIVAYLIIQIGKFIDDDTYFVLTGESGVHLDHRNNLANDIAIFDQAVLTPAKISKKYADVPPRIAIEVDIETDTYELTENGYIYKKTRKLSDRSGDPVRRSENHMGTDRSAGCPDCYSGTYRNGELG